MKVFTKSLFLITLGFNSLVVRDSEATAARARAREAAEKAAAEQPIIQQREAERQRLLEAEQKQQLIEKDIRRAKKIASIENMVDRKIEASANLINEKINNLEQKVDAMDKKLDFVLNQFSNIIEKILLTL